jgi:predicted HNH restriction endonuclease
MGAILGDVGHLLQGISSNFDQPVPKIQCLVVLKNGAGKNLPDEGIKEFWPDWSNLSVIDRERRVREEIQKVADFGIRWNDVLAMLRLPEISEPVPMSLFPINSEDSVSNYSESNLWEGGKTTAIVNRYERDSRARSECVKIFGAKCSVCMFDFEMKYGEIGKGHIHVHHLKPLSARGRRYKVDPREDLRPVCPNCHEMLHTRKPEPYTIEELTILLRA